MNYRPFGASGDAPGTLSSTKARPEPILPVPAIPGGTLMSPVPRPGTRALGAYPAQSGTGAYVSRQTVLQMTAINGRGAGPAGSRAKEGRVHAGMRTAGVRSNHGLLGAIVRADPRNPYVARHLLRSGMVAGATRVR